MTLTERLDKVQEHIEELKAHKIQNEITTIYIKRLKLLKRYLALHFFYRYSAGSRERDIVEAIYILRDMVDEGKYAYIPSNSYRYDLSPVLSGVVKNVRILHRFSFNVLQKAHKKKIEAKLSQKLTSNDYKLYCCLKEARMYKVLHCKAFSSEELGKAVVNKLKITILY